MNYTTPAGRIFDIKEVLDTPFWSRKQAPAASGKVNFFDESGSPNADSNMVAAGQFSNSQTFICRQIQLDLSVNAANIAFATLGLINDIAELIHGSIIILDKNRGQDWQCHFNKILAFPTSPIGTGAAWDSIDKSIQGRYVFNEPIVFGPGETFTFTTEYTGPGDVSLLDTMFTFMGFLGIEKVVTST